jgi:hypothetical protein
MCLSKDLLIQSSREYFDLDYELLVYSGAQMMHVLFFNRKNSTKEDNDAGNTDKIDDKIMNQRIREV